MSPIDHRKRHLFSELQHWLWEHQWLMVGALSAISLVLGYAGFSAYLAGKPHTPSDLVYLSLQLFTLQGGIGDTPVPLALDVARFLAPAVTAWAAIRAVLSLLRDQRQRFQLRFLRRHVVVCGLGEKGWLLVQECRERGWPVVVIEDDPSNRYVAPARELGALVLHGSAADITNLRRARVEEARLLFAVCSDDSTNAEIASLIPDLSANGHVRGPGTAWVHLTDMHLCDVLRRHELTASSRGLGQIKFFNVYQKGAQAILSGNPPFEGGGGTCQPHMLVVGLGILGQALLVKAAQLWWPQFKRGFGQRLRITVVDEEAEARLALVTVRYPQLSNCCDLIVRPIRRLPAPELESGDVLLDNTGSCTVQHIYICLPEAAAGLAAGMALHRRANAARVRSVICVLGGGGLASLVEKYETSQGNLQTFDLLDHACRLDVLAENHSTENPELGGTVESLAHAIHQQYVADQLRAGDSAELNPALRPWENLSSDLRELNRAQASAIPGHLAAAGCEVEHLYDWDAPWFAFSDAEVEMLAQREHDRWYDQKRAQGWSHGRERDNERKINPYLTTWTTLPPEVQERNREVVRSWPRLLRAAGFQVCRSVQQEVRSN